MGMCEKETNMAYLKIHTMSNLPLILANDKICQSYRLYMSSSACKEEI